MKNNEYLFCSQFEYFTIVIPILAVFWVLCLVYFDEAHLLSVWLFFLIPIMFSYLLFAIYYKRFYFYNNQIIRVFIFRPFYRKTVFKYEQFFKVKYIHVGGGIGEYPRFIIYRKKRQYFHVFNTFTFDKHVKRVEMVEFLLSKNVVMEVRSTFPKKEREIIDLVKKKYPKNIRNY